MSGTEKRASVALVAAAASLLSLGAPALAQSKPLTKVVFTLDFIPLGRHAPWYAALGAGYFRKEGLDVKIIPAQGTAQALQALDSGVAQLGFIDAPTLLFGRAGGSKIKMVAVNYQKSPYAVFSLKSGADVTSLKKFQGLNLGSGSGSFTPAILRGLMKLKGLDPNKLKVSNIAPSARATMLLAGKAPAIEFFVMSQPGLEAAAKKENKQLVTYLIADHGLNLYSNGIAASDSLIKSNPGLVRRFVRAALKGWRLAFNHPNQAAAYEMKYVPTLKKAAIVKELAIVRRLAVTSDTKKHGLGWFNAAKFKQTRDFVVKYIGVKGKAPKASDLYATGFLPKKPILP